MTAANVSGLSTFPSNQIINKYKTAIIFVKMIKHIFHFVYFIVHLGETEKWDFFEITHTCIKVHDIVIYL